MQRIFTLTDFAARQKTLLPSEIVISVDCRCSCVALVLQTAVEALEKFTTQSDRATTEYCTTAHGLIIVYLLPVKQITLQARQRNKSSNDIHVRLTALLSGNTRVSRHQKGITNLDFTEARDSEWQWHQLGHNYASLHIAPDR